MVTKNDITSAAKALGIEQGDSLLIHSSFKSFGGVDGGAATVICGFMEAIGEEGTLLFPTLCQNDWEHVYENWHLDAESDVGYLTNYFRKLSLAKRSDQATHSVAAMGRDAVFFTETHGKTGLRYGIFGDTPFSADSPWEKMYQRNTKVVFIGVNMYKCTFRHYAEYCYVEKLLSSVADTEEYEALKHRLWCYERWNEQGVWPHINSEYVRALLDKKSAVAYTKCGDAEIMCVPSQVFVRQAWHELSVGNLDVMGGGQTLWQTWVEDVKAAKSKKEDALRG